MTPNITLREFLNASTARLSVAVGSFIELTAMAEIALYSAHDPTPDSAARAKQIAGTIKEEMDRGAS